jgi:hypothetical protein
VCKGVDDFAGVVGRCAVNDDVLNAGVGLAGNAVKTCRDHIGAISTDGNDGNRCHEIDARLTFSVAGPTPLSHGCECVPSRHFKKITSRLQRETPVDRPSMALLFVSLR